MGRTVMQPRCIAYMADDAGLAYTYSGLALQPAPWAPVVAQIKVFHLLCCMTTHILA